MASWKGFGVSGHHREDRQGASTDEFDRIVAYGERNSPVGSSNSNGFVERANQSVQGMIRTFRSDVEEKLGV